MWLYTPDLMAKVGKLVNTWAKVDAKPKAGTVTTDMKKAVSDIKAGKIQYRTDKDEMFMFLLENIY